MNTAFYPIGLLLICCTNDDPMITQPLINETPIAHDLPIANNDSLLSQLNFKPTASYALSRSATKSRLVSLQEKRLPPDSLLAEANTLFVHELLNTIIPHWYGTTWNFNGHTSKPKKGEIACGYFVSTTLQHMGLQLNRYRMAQQSALSEAKTIALGREVQVMYPSEEEIETLAFATNMKDGLYLVGLSNHVGYFYLHDGHGFFIHSDYVSGAVRFENASTSEAFKSDILCFASISGNSALMKRWLNGVQVSVVLD